LSALPALPFSALPLLRPFLRRRAPPVVRSPAHWADPTTGLHFTKRGEYDPDTGRYLVPQPDAPKGSNPYLFMNGNPMQAALKPFAPY